MPYENDEKNSGSVPAEPRDLHTLTRGELQELLSSLGQPKFRAKQIEEWVWVKNARSFDEMSNLPKTLREDLSRHLGDARSPQTEAASTCCAIRTA